MWTCGATGCYPNFDYLLDLDAAADAGPPPESCPEAGVEGSTFTDLYRDFFGPDGGASCTAQSICHVPGGTGFQVAHWACFPDQAGCWKSMSSTIVSPSGMGSRTPEETTLYRALRKAPPTPSTGPMPKDSTFAFEPADLERIEAWICEGAKNN